MSLIGESGLYRVGKAIKEFIAVLEEGPRHWSAYVPDLPGCVAAGDSRQETELLIQEAAQWHLEGLVEDGDTIPEPKYRGPGLTLRVAVPA